MTFLRSLYLTLMALTAFGCAAPLRRPCDFTLKVRVLDTVNADFECRRLGVKWTDKGWSIKDRDTVRGCAGDGFIITNGTPDNVAHELNHEIERVCK